MPEAVMEAPPAAPTPAPSPTPSPQPAATPKAEVPLTERVTNKVFRRNTPQPPEPKPEPKVEAPEPSPEPPQPKEGEKPSEVGDQKPAPTPAPAPEKGKKTPWQIVHERDDTIKTLTRQLEELQGKSLDDHPKFKELNTQLEAERKRAEKVEDELRYQAYERHPEFQDKYVKPYESSWNTGRQRLSQLTVTDADGNTRKGTAEDFDALFQLRQSNPDQAAQKMGEMFGLKAAAVEGLMLQVEDRLNSMQQAREDFRQKGLAKMKQEQEQRSTQAKALSEAIEKSFKAQYDAVPKEHPELFNEVEGDETGNAALKAGYESAKKAFAQLNPYDPKLTQEQREQVLRLHAETLHYAAASRRLIQWRKQDQATIAELRAKIADYEKTEPGAGDGGKPQPQEEVMVDRVQKRLQGWKR